MKRSLALFFLICALLARPTFAQSQDEDEPEANPGRPKGAWPMFSSARRAFCIRAKVPSPRLRSATFIASTMAELRNSISEARFHYDANAFFTELVEEPVRRAQFGQSLTISHPFLKNFILSAKIWHFTQPFLRSNAVGNLWAVSYTARKTRNEG